MPKISHAAAKAQVVSNSSYASSGLPAPKSIEATGRPGTASGEAVTDFTTAITRVSGLQVLRTPTAENYRDIGQVLTIGLGPSTGSLKLDVTRVNVRGNVPKSVLVGPGESTTTRRLKSGSTLVTASGADKQTVSTLSQDGRLTVWKAPTHVGGKGIALRRLIKWASAVDGLKQGAVAVQSTMLPLVAASCDVLQYGAPYVHAGAVQADATLDCNQSGTATFSVSIEQYRGLGIWSTKATDDIVNSKGSIFPIAARWTRASGTGTQTYRSRVGVASLRTTSTYWAGNRTH
jgi:hypothetical protein